MKVLGPTLTLFDVDPFPSPWGWGSPRIWFRDPAVKYRIPKSDTVLRQIPIQYEGKRSTGFHDITADNDDDDLRDNWDEENRPDVNNNGTPRNKRRQESLSTRGRRGPSHNSFAEAGHHGGVIDLDNLDDEDVEGSSIPEKRVKENCSCYDDDWVFNGSTYTYCPGQSRKPRTKSVSWNLDTTGEKEVNETPSYSVYKYLCPFLQSSGQQIDYIKGDGNCFFRALSKILYGTELMYEDMREAVCDLMTKFPKKFEQFIDEKNIFQHIEEMRKDKVWATQTEIYAAATLLQRDIYVLSPYQDEHHYRWLHFSPLFHLPCEFSDHPCFITLCHTHGNHYDRILPIGKSRCNCDLDPPQMTGICTTVDLTNDDITDDVADDDMDVVEIV